MNEQDRQFREVAAWLERPDAYPDRPRSVTCRETHISCVFLTDRQAYKLKKPVRYDFLDFSAPDLRRHACEEELRLNRRLAGDVYQEIVPITRDATGALRLGGDGLPIDWVVRMRRLDTEQTLDRLIANGRLTDRNVQQLAAKLTEFYAAAPRLAVGPAEVVAAIERHVRANRHDLLAAERGMPAAVAQRVHGAQLQFLAIDSDLLARRVRDGRVIEGHGDLRPEHVCFDGDPVVFDCIEFNAEFRQIDVVDELCFLAMECERLGAPSVGDTVLAAYGRATGDCPPQSLLDFYESYRACVRAKVAVLRGDQVPAGDLPATRVEAATYLELADRYASRFASPLAIVVGGLMGTGKSTLAAAVADKLAAPQLRTDVVRREMFGAETAPSEYAAGAYRPENRTRVYEEVIRRAERFLADRQSVVMDGTFSTDWPRRQAADAATRSGAGILFLRCHCSAEESRRRIASRQATHEDASEARPELFERQFAEEEPWSAEWPLCHVDTTQSLPAQVEQVVNALRASLARSTEAIQGGKQQR